MNKPKNGKIKVYGIVLLSVLIILLLGMHFFMTEITSKPTMQIRQQCKIEEKYYKNRKVFIIEPKQTDNKDIVIVYLHGGSYVAEMSTKHWEFIGDFVQDTGIKVILPDYPLTPKYNYKDVFEMIIPLYQEIIEKTNEKKIIIMGDSAGGGMSLALCEKIGEMKIRKPEKLILISPWLDVTMSNERIGKVQKYDRQLNKEALKLAGISYAGKDGIQKYLVNPINGPIKDLKEINIIVYTGTSDILNPDVEILQDKAKKEEIEIQVRQYNNQEHIWMLERGKDKTKEAQEAYEDCVKEVLNT